MKLLRLFAASTLIAFAALAPQAAGAAQPVRFPSQAFTGTFAAGVVCPFAVYTEPAGPTQTETLFFDSAGNVTRIQFTGASLILLRNVDTQKTLIEHANGEGTLIPQPDGSLLGQGAGPGLFGLFAGDSFGPALLLVLGRDTFTITAPDASGATHIQNLVLTGQVIDLCAALAA